jgi:ubiquinone/menaquinone biosynthesis C-methylase UbiE
MTEARNRTGFRLPPIVYDAVQHALGWGPTLARLAPHFAALEGSTVLDVGSGTAAYASLLPRSARYICLDHDFGRLARLKSRHADARPVVSDATQMALRTHSVDAAVCIAVAHHLDDVELERLFSELARTVRKRLIFLDPLHAPDRLASRLLWSLDAGHHPRSEAALLEHLSASFIPQSRELYAIQHRYVLCVASPRHA